MTTIKLALNDQRLFALNKVTLASGDINSVQMEVEFCDAWADYPVRFAHFAVQTADRLVLSSQTDTIPDVLMIDNKAIIPATALAESGVLYIGVYGDSLDGTARKTSIGEVKFIIHKGASGAKTTIAPESDAFMQYLAAMDAKIDPLMKAAVEQMQNTMAAQYKTFTDKVAADLEEFKNQYVEGVVLWKSDVESVLLDCNRHLYDSRNDEMQIEFDATGYCKFVVELTPGGLVHIPYDGASIQLDDAYVFSSSDKSLKSCEIEKNKKQLMTSENAEWILVTDSGATFKLVLPTDYTYDDGEYIWNYGYAPIAIIGYKDTSIIEMPDIEFV